jgi:hypothetical protein
MMAVVSFNGMEVRVLYNTDQKLEYSAIFYKKQYETKMQIM